MRIRLLLIPFSFLLVYACSPTPPQCPTNLGGQTPQPSCMQGDGGLDALPDSSHTWPNSRCGKACQSFEAAGCPEAFPNVDAGEQDCVTSCEKTVQSGISSFNPDCVAAAKTATDIRKCPVTRCLK